MNIATMQESATMSSREMAQLCDTAHDAVLKSVRLLIEKGVVSANETQYIHPQNKQSYPEYLLNFRDSMILVSGYSVELRAKIIDRWQQLERQVAQPVQISYAESLRLLADNIEARERAEQQLAITAPKAEVFDTIANAEGTFNLTDAAKILGVQPKKRFIPWLLENKWIFRKGEGIHPYQDKVAKGWMKPIARTFEGNTGADHNTMQTRILGAGMTELGKHVEAIKKFEDKL